MFSVKIKENVKTDLNKFISVKKNFSFYISEIENILFLISFNNDLKLKSILKNKNLIIKDLIIKRNNLNLKRFKEIKYLRNTFKNYSINYTHKNKYFNSFNKLKNIYSSLKVYNKPFNYLLFNDFYNQYKNTFIYLNVLNNDLNNLLRNIKNKVNMFKGYEKTFKSYYLTNKDLKEFNKFKSLFYKIKKEILKSKSEHSLKEIEFLTIKKFKYVLKSNKKLNVKYLKLKSKIDLNLNSYFRILKRNTRNLKKEYLKEVSILDLKFNVLNYSEVKNTIQKYLKQNGLKIYLNQNQNKEIKINKKLTF